MNFQKVLVDNFLRYVSVPSQSNASSKEVPSSKGQFDLANLLKKELEELGFVNINIDEHCILTAKLEGTKAGDKIGFCCHLDTVDVSLSDVIHPQIIKFDGNEVVLNKEKNIVLNKKNALELFNYVGEDIIFTDGTSVLGADNKAAIANVMTCFAYIKENNIEHSDIYVAFVPDEEIGLKGSKLLDVEKFPVDYAYTIDCCKLGEVVYETFNAASVSIDIQGVSAHPMSSKGVLVNPLLVAHDLMNMFPRLETPENTDAKDGYWWFIGCHADQSKCHLDLHIRDFDKDSYKNRCEYVLKCVETLQKMHPRASIKCTIEDIYANIANNVDESSKPVAQLFDAIREVGVTPYVYAMRGGTDGSCLSARGIVTPNYFTGAHNFHSFKEFLPISSFVKSAEVTLKLIEKALNK